MQSVSMEKVDSSENHNNAIISEHRDIEGTPQHQDDKYLSKLFESINNYKATQQQQASSPPVNFLIAAQKYLQKQQKADNDAPDGERNGYSPDIYAELNCFLLVVDLKNEVCVHISESASGLLGMQQNEAIGSKMDKLLASEEKEKYWKSLSQGANGITLCAVSFYDFNKKQQEEETTNNNNQTQQQEMAVINLYEEASGKGLLLALVARSKRYGSMADSNNNNNNTTTTATTRIGPPNRTIESKTPVPQPDMFITRHTISGKISLVTDPRLPPQPVKRSDMIDRYLTALNKTIANGSSLAQTLHARAVKQGEARSPPFKFRLGDGSTVTAFTKSKFMTSPQKQEPPFVISFHYIYKDGNLNHHHQDNRNKLQSSAKNNTSSTEDASGVIKKQIATTNLIKQTTNLTGDKSTTNQQQQQQQLPQGGGGGDLLDYFISNNTSSSYAASSAVLRQRNSVEVAKELLMSTGADGNTAQKLLNSVIEAPPHLDGYLVHKVGAAQFTSIQSSNNLAASNSSPAAATSKEMLGRMDLNSNLATFQNPPTVDLAMTEVPQTSSAQLQQQIKQQQQQQTTAAANNYNNNGNSGELVMTSHDHIMTSSRPLVNGAAAASSSSGNPLQLMTSPIVTSPTGSAVDGFEAAAMNLPLPPPPPPPPPYHIKQEPPAPPGGQQQQQLPVVAPPSGGGGGKLGGGFGLAAWSKEERDELDEILESFSDVIYHQQFDESSAMTSSSSTSAAAPFFNLSSCADLLVNQQLNEQQQQGETSNNLTTTTATNGNTATQMNNNNQQQQQQQQQHKVAAIAPDLDGCPNVVVLNNGDVSSHIIHPSLVSRDVTQHDVSISNVLGLDLGQCEGQEPLIDLGADPPPAGINPRMTIPYPPSANTMAPPTPQLNASINQLTNQQQNYLLQQNPPQQKMMYSTAPNNLLGPAPMDSIMTSHHPMTSQQRHPSQRTIHHNMQHQQQVVTCSGNKQARYQLQLRLSQPQQWRGQTDEQQQQNCIRNPQQQQQQPTRIIQQQQQQQQYIQPNRFPQPGNFPQVQHTTGNTGNMRASYQPNPTRLADGKHLIQKHQRFQLNPNNNNPMGGNGISTINYVAATGQPMMATAKHPNIQQQQQQNYKKQNNNAFQQQMEMKSFNSSDFDPGIAVQPPKRLRRQRSTTRKKSTTKQQQQQQQQPVTSGIQWQKLITSNQQQPQQRSYLPPKVEPKPLLLQMTFGNGHKRSQLSTGSQLAAAAAGGQHSTGSNQLTAHYPPEGVSWSLNQSLHPQQQQQVVEKQMMPQQQMMTSPVLHSNVMTSPAPDGGGFEAMMTSQQPRATAGFNSPPANYPPPPPPPRGPMMMDSYNNWMEPPILTSPTAMTYDKLHQTASLVPLPPNGSGNPATSGANPPTSGGGGDTSGGVTSPNRKQQLMTTPQQFSISANHQQPMMTSPVNNANRNNNNMTLTSPLTSHYTITATTTVLQQSPVVTSSSASVAGAASPVATSVVTSSAAAADREPLSLLETLLLKKD